LIANRKVKKQAKFDKWLAKKKAEKGDEEGEDE
jgi:hypothetical protein